VWEGGPESGSAPVLPVPYLSSVQFMAMKPLIILIALLAALFLWDYALNDANLYASLNAYVDEFMNNLQLG